MTCISPESLGNSSFLKDYGVKYAYVAGAMYKGIASKELVVALGRAGLLGYLGTGGMPRGEVEASIRHIQSALDLGQPFGMNLLCNIERPELEEEVVELCLKYSVRFVEAAAFIRLTPSVVRYRLSGISENSRGEVLVPNRVLAKVSRPEVAMSFMQPAPASILDQLVAAGQLTPMEARLGRRVPVAHEICVEADSGGHTDQGVAYALMPAIFGLRDEMQARFAYRKPILVGAAGGLGTPHAVAAAFAMGADFILTGSINQCTVEAGTSDSAKDLLQGVGVSDTAYAPAGDMFELGAKVQVVKRGVFFPGRANKLYELYQRHNSLDEIDAGTRHQIEAKYFRRSFEDVWQETRAHYSSTNPGKLADIESNPRKKMLLVFRWYFVHSTRLAMCGDESQKMDYQIQCGPAMGSFNQWVKGTELEAWRNRRVADIGERLMCAAAALLQANVAAMIERSNRVIADDPPGKREVRLPCNPG